jgi:exodeoxyribonuclease V beta subunit
MTLVHDLEPCNTDGMRKRFAARCAQQIVTWLNDPKAGFAQKSEAGEGDKLTPLRPADIAILVRTGKEAACVQRELARRAIASVYLSDKESVLQSPEARDLVHWLKAVASPQEIRLVRAGLATRTLGLSLNELGWLASNDEAFDARCEQLRQLRSTWQLQGVLAMLRQTLHQFHLAAKFLAEPGGERSLTNVLHLAELLQNASTMLDGEQALIRWLMTQIQEETAQSDEQVVRLESDADLVKVITIHKSKGLEYPVVCLPFSASFREKESKTTTFVNLADAQGQRELKLQFSKEELALADKDRLREDVRLLYVALTRARHALWVGFSVVKVGKSEKCMSHKSAAGYLLGGTEQIDASDWLPVLEAFANGQAGLVLQTATNDTPCTPLERALDEEPLKDFCAYQGDFERDWSIGSFSGFTRNLATLPTAAPPMGTQLSPLQVTRPADDEIEPMDETTVMAPKNTQDQSDDMNWHTFVRGSEAGNFLHDQLEWLATEHFALADNEAALARLTRSCERCGRALQADLVANWLTQVVQTVLPGPNVVLAALTNVMQEMEFWLPVHQMQAKRMDAHCREHLLPGVDRPALADRQLHGMLMGFADLVFEHQGRYWVLDYKSNHLGDSDAQYDSTALEHAMAEHRYDVQAAIYMLALHRLLQARLGENYQPEQHLGGAVYLFLRGIKGPQNGVCLIPASMPLIDSLNAMLLEEVLS